MYEKRRKVFTFLQFSCEKVPYFQQYAKLHFECTVYVTYEIFLVVSYEFEQSS